MNLVHKKVPFLVIDRKLIAESVIILQYITEIRIKGNIILNGQMFFYQKIGGIHMDLCITSS